MRPRFLLDTNVLIDLQRRPNPQLTGRFASLQQGEAALSVIVFGELLTGVNKSTKAAASLAFVESLILALPLLPLPVEAAREYGILRAYLKDTGKLIGNNDLWIAAHALAEDLTLVTANTGEFSRVKGLHYENWSSA
jgi:tRNA(fMet)-specific endonuclease VapC